MWLESKTSLRVRFPDAEIPLELGVPIYLAEDRALRLLVQAGDQIKLLLNAPASCVSPCDLVVGQHIQWSNPRGTRSGTGILELVETNPQTMWVLVEQRGHLLWVHAAALTTLNSKPIIWLKKSRGAQRGNHKERGGENYAKESVQKKGA